MFFDLLIQLQENIIKKSTIDKKEMQLSMTERLFSSDVLERLIHIISFRKSLVFRDFEEALDPLISVKFLGLFELWGKKGFQILNGLHKKITLDETKIT